jgi:trans-aconitate methyltransferase
MARTRPLTTPEMSSQIWNSANYARHGRFVADHGTPLLELLAARPNESILDLGCGDGVLTKRIADLGCQVVGVDSSPELVASARGLGLHVVESDAADMVFDAQFDAVFSNGALHWMKNADAVIKRVANALRSEGRFVAAMGGHDSIRPLIDELAGELNRRGYDGEAANPWYFPTCEDYAARLCAAGFEVDYIALSSEATPLPGDALVWVTALGRFFSAALPEDQQRDYLECIRRRVESRSQKTSAQSLSGTYSLRFRAHLSA